MHVIRHDAEGPGDDTMAPSQMIVQTQIKNAVSCRIEDDVPIDCSDIDVMRTAITVFPVISTHIPALQCYSAKIFDYLERQ